MKWSVFAGLMWGVYYAGSHDWLGGLVDRPEAARAIRKSHAVKPDSMKQDQKEVLPLPAAPGPRFTFFDTLRDAELVRYVDLEGRVVKKKVRQWMEDVEKSVTEEPVLPRLGRKIDAVLRTEIPDEPRAVIPPNRAPEKTLIAQGEPALPRATGQFVVQVSSFRESGLARDLESQLRAKGFPAFVSRARLPGREGQWHRVFLGRYRNWEDAQVAAREARRYRLRPIVLKESG